MEKQDQLRVVIRLLNSSEFRDRLYFKREVSTIVYYSVRNEAGRDMRSAWVYFVRLAADDGRGVAIMVIVWPEKKEKPIDLPISGKKLEEIISKIDRGVSIIDHELDSCYDREMGFSGAVVNSAPVPQEIKNFLIRKGYKLASPYL